MNIFILKIIMKFEISEQFLKLVFHVFFHFRWLNYNNKNNNTI